MSLLKSNLSYSEEIEFKEIELYSYIDAHIRIEVIIFMLVLWQ
ncbi:MAG TPA: hypothetical protein PLD35_04340 [Caldisericia bacterium]|nr:hypothetical protein [Caldisericia bacterium]HQG81904.1 hypothetical protein [Caldisericia bacterium]